MSAAYVADAIRRPPVCPARLEPPAQPRPDRSRTFIHRRGNARWDDGMVGMLEGRFSGPHLESILRVGSRVGLPSPMADGRRSHGAMAVDGDDRRHDVKDVAVGHLARHNTCVAIPLAFIGNRACAAPDRARGGAQALCRALGFYTLLGPGARRS